MHFYRTYLLRSGLAPENTVSHRCTLAEAHACAKAFGKSDWNDVVVDLIDVPTDKAGVLSLLMGGHGIDDLKAIRTWDLTPRGGLREAALED